MHLGLAIKSVRIHLNINQKKFAVICAISQNSLSQIENGIKSPKETTLTRVCDAFQMPECLMYLLALEEKDIAPAKRHFFPVLHKSISTLALQVASYPADRSEVREIN